MCSQTYSQEGYLTVELEKYGCILIVIFHHFNGTRVLDCRKGEDGAHAVKRVAAGAHLPTPWLFEPANSQTIKPTTDGSSGLK